MTSSVSKRSIFNTWWVGNVKNNSRWKKMFIFPALNKPASWLTLYAQTCRYIPPPPVYEFACLHVHVCILVAHENGHPCVYVCAIPTALGEVLMLWWMLRSFKGMFLSLSRMFSLSGKCSPGSGGIFLRFWRMLLSFHRIFLSLWKMFSCSGGCSSESGWRSSRSLGHSSHFGGRFPDSEECSSDFKGCSSHVVECSARSGGCSRILEYFLPVLENVPLALPKPWELKGQDGSRKLNVFMAWESVSSQSVPPAAG